MGDDGVGPAVIHAFQAEYVVGPNVDVVDIGTPGLDLAPWLTDAEHVILIDTIRSKLTAGTVLVFDKDELLRYPPAVRTGPHDPGVKQALLALEFAGRGPRALTLIGIVPERVEMSTELSAAVQGAIPAALDAVVKALNRRGEPVQRRAYAAADAKPSGIGHA